MRCFAPTSWRRATSPSPPCSWRSRSARACRPTARATFWRSERSRRRSTGTGSSLAGSGSPACRRSSPAPTASSARSPTRSWSSSCGRPPRGTPRRRTDMEEESATHGWHTYAIDHLALMDHLGHRRFHVMGGCIGGTFCLTLCEMAPERVTAAVLQNPIGLHENQDTWDEAVSGFAKTMLARDSTLTEDVIRKFGHNMFGGDFVFSVGGVSV